MRRAVSGVTLLASLTNAGAGSLAGKYQIPGKNLDGSPYSGTAESVATSDTTCRISWQTGAATSQGICMRNGNSFAASYASAIPSGSWSIRSSPTGRSKGLEWLSSLEGRVQSERRMNGSRD